MFQAIQADLDNVRAAWFWALNHESLPLLQQSLKSLRTFYNCLLYTSDAADERSSVDLGGRRIFKKKIKTDK